MFPVRPSVHQQMPRAAWRSAAEFTAPEHAVNKRSRCPPMPLSERRHNCFLRQSLRGWRNPWKSLPVASSATSNRAGCEGAASTIGTARPTITVSLTGTPKSLGEKNLEPTQALFPRPPIAPVSPGASLCPSGNQWGRQQPEFIESRIGSTGLSQKSSWITPSG